jgi:hypothetical protein
VSIDPGVFTEIDFSYIHSYAVGGVRVTIGRLTSEGNLDPVVYAAALSEHDLHHRQRGFGSTRAEAVADLFRLLR